MPRRRLELSAVVIGALSRSRLLVCLPQGTPSCPGRRTLCVNDSGAFVIQSFAAGAEMGRACPLGEGPEGSRLRARALLVVASSTQP